MNVFAINYNKFYKILYFYHVNQTSDPKEQKLELAHLTKIKLQIFAIKSNIE